MSWSEDDRNEFAWMPNFDALWLGAEPRGLWRLPGTTLRGRLILTRDFIKLRTVKDATELKLMRSAAQASVKAVREVLPLLVPGAREADIGEAIRAAHKRAGCSGESFPPVVAAGPNAAEPHGTGNRGTLQAGQMVMLDVGCLFGGYASDYTRTLPVGGRFSPEQRARYDAVWAGQQAALRACGPGAREPGRSDPTSLDAIAHRTIQEKGFDDHNPYGIGHPVGLFVHDLALPGPLQPQMVVTIEPGLYEKGRLGIRIEDTYLVTDSGCEQLTSGMPADADAIEVVMRASVAAPAAERSTER
jgi:Xaa-Pro aminopeptidase